jgi:hypothetical protein
MRVVLLRTLAILASAELAVTALASWLPAVLGGTGCHQLAGR